MGISRHFELQKNYACGLDTAENSSIPTYQNSSKLLDQNVLTFLLINI